MKIYSCGESKRINIINKDFDIMHDNNSKYVVYYKDFLYIIYPHKNTKSEVINLSMDFLYFEFSK